MKKVANYKIKLLAAILSLTLVWTMMPPIAFAAAEDNNTSSSSTNSYLVSYSIDKSLLSENETLTVTVEMAQGYEANYISYYKPITKNTKVISLYEVSDNVYSGSFKVDAQTESGLWEVSNFCYYNENREWTYIRNSNTYTGSSYEVCDFSPVNFEVIGTSADVIPPVLKSFSVDRTVVSSGEKINFSVTLEDDHLSDKTSLWYIMPSGESKTIYLNRVSESGLYEGAFTIDSNTELGKWVPKWIGVEDSNGNDELIYNSAAVSYGSTKVDLSALDFEVITSDDNTTEDDSSGTVEKTFVVVFKDGFGNTLSTQRVSEGKSAVAPSDPTNDLYIFDGWDIDFTNITNNLTVTAKWVDNPEVTPDINAHVGQGFKISVKAPVNQTYNITCNKDIDFTSILTGSTYTNIGAAYYGKTYTVTTDTPGNYYFYVKGSVSTNTLTYKVQITDHNYEITTIAPTCIAKGYDEHKCSICENVYKDNYVDIVSVHNWDDNYVIDIEATCTKIGSKSIHCIDCGMKKAGSDVVVPVKAHNVVNNEYVEPTCSNTGSIGGSYCHDCGAIITKPTILPMRDHYYYIEYSADIDASELICYDCGEYFGILNYYDSEEGRWYIYDFVNNDPNKHIVCDEMGNPVKTETCKVDSWYGTEAGHVGSCKCQAIVADLIDHSVKTTITKASSVKNGKSVTKCKVCEYVASSYTIAKPNKIKLSTAKYVYNGKAKKPTVKVYDSKGNLIAASNYTVKYANGRKNVGKYKVTVTFKNTSKKYKGSFSTTFKIVPKATSITKLTKAKKAFTVKWKKKTTQVSGYQIRYSTKSDMSNAKTKLVKSYKTTSKKITGLKGGKKYYVQVRTYKTVNGTKYYSAWSGKKSVKTTGSSSSNTSNNDVISGNTVYITSTGTKYHFNKNCRGLSNANGVKSVSLSSAKAQGYTLCGYED